MHDAATDSVLVEKFKVSARVGRQRGIAPAQDDWLDEQSQLIDQPGRESLRREVRAAHD